MGRRMAAKRLTASDLTFFLWHFRNANAGNQKSINLNANVFVDNLYPVLGEAPVERLPLDLYLYGPGLAPERNLQRKIIKGRAYKNWRLNGEFVDAQPDDPPDRYRSLQGGDIAVFDFFGDPYPAGARVVLLARSEAADTALHEQIAQMIPADDRHSMIPLDAATLGRVLDAAAAPPEHPLRDLQIDQDLAEAAVGNQDAIERLRRRPRLRRLTDEDLARSRANAERVGASGEDIVNSFLADQADKGEIREYTWASRENAIEPYDFRFVAMDGTQVLTDVKSTEGEFSRPIHVSLNELICMAGADLSGQRYDLCRVYLLGQDAASTRWARGVSGWARTVLSALEGLPPGVKVDGVSVAPDTLAFGDESFIGSDVRPSD